VIASSRRPVRRPRISIPISVIRPSACAFCASSSPTSPSSRALQVHNQYLVTQDGQGLLIVDQHALHERIMFEELRRRILDERASLESQRLLMPEVIDADDGRQSALEDLQPLLARLGIEASPIGPSRVAVHAFPSLLFARNVKAGPFMQELLDKAEAGAFDELELGDGSIKLQDFLQTLRARRFDLALDFHGILKSGLLARLSGAPVRVGYGRGVAREGAFLFVNRRVRLGSPRISRFERNAALVRRLSPDAPIPERLVLSPSPMAQARLAARLRVSGRERDEGFVLIHPGSSRGALHKRYPVEAWGETARRLSSDGLAVWLVSGSNRNERSLVERIVQSSEGTARPAPETRSFDDLLALIARASVFVSSDSGPLHAASMVGVPVVQLLGPTDPTQNQPWPGSPHRRLSIPLPCSPCRHGCADPACMRLWPPAKVCAAIRSMHAYSVRGATGSAEAPP